MKNKEIIECILLENPDFNPKYFLIIFGDLICLEKKYYEKLKEVCSIISDKLHLFCSDNIIKIKYGGIYN